MSKAWNKTRTPSYLAWDAMVQRCENPKHPNYKHYGGRGITVHPSLRKFDGFLAEAGERPSKGHSIDRVDNSKGYEPGNLRWATKREQLLNRRNNHLLTYNGKTQSLEEWAVEMKLEYGTLQSRLKYGWSVEKALTSPLVKMGRPRTRPRKYSLGQAVGAKSS